MDLHQDFARHMDLVNVVSAFSGAVNDWPPPFGRPDPAKRRTDSCTNLVANIRLGRDMRAKELQDSKHEPFFSSLDQGR